MTYSEALALAQLIGGDAWHAGQHVWLVLKQLPNGTFLSISDEAVAFYASKADFDADGNPAWVSGPSLVREAAIAMPPKA